MPRLLTLLFLVGLALSQTSCGLLTLPVRSLMRIPTSVLRVDATTDSESGEVGIPAAEEPESAPAA